jgi:hypothetical protein
LTGRTAAAAAAAMASAASRLRRAGSSGRARPARLLGARRTTTVATAAPWRRGSSAVMDWSQKGPDWKRRGRSQEELYVARAEAELLRKRRAANAGGSCDDDEGSSSVSLDAGLDAHLHASDLPGGSGGGDSGVPSPSSPSSPNGAGDASASLAVEALHAVLGAAIDGEHLSSSAELAAEYTSDRSLRTVDERVASLINWESGKGFASGFTTGVGGVFALPVALPAAVWASWTMQARLSGAIAELHGFDTRDEFTRTCVAMALLDTWSPCPMAPPLDDQRTLYENEDTHKYVSRKLLREFYLNARAPSMAALAAAQRHVCHQLVSRAAARGAAGGLGRAVPFVSGVIGGTADATALQFAGQSAHTMFGKIRDLNDRSSSAVGVPPPPRAEPCVGGAAGVGAA